MGTDIIGMAVDPNMDEPEVLSRYRFAVLLTSVMLVSMTYGVTLPALPFVTERILGVGNATIAWHAGMLTTLYTFALFFFSPVWGIDSSFPVDRNYRWRCCGWRNETQLASSSNGTDVFVPNVTSIEVSY